MKYVNLIFAILFLVSAALQYNDPDPYLWIPIYLLSAFLCFQASRQIFYPRLSVAAAVAFLAYGIFLFFDKYGVLSWLTEHEAENLAVTMKASKPWIEETREFFGLLIILFVFLLNYLSFRGNFRQ